MTTWYTTAVRTYYTAVTKRREHVMNLVVRGYMYSMIYRVLKVNVQMKLDRYCQIHWRSSNVIARKIGIYA